ncbi:hypothetical protein DICVIV_12704 [Dictyocaulus viviparus]|uniref:Uncharacterized protein n=1 Tax=Dictyocaulus viviparus TaxID=29172 RepID=A0A0D8XCF2_DICVI|nr:hypothetical protein DICVIV_12704 [Dictyocaulus viviparus]
MSGYCNDRIGPECATLRLSESARMSGINDEEKLNHSAVVADEFTQSQQRVMFKVGRTGDELENLIVELRFHDGQSTSEAIHLLTAYCRTDLICISKVTMDSLMTHKRLSNFVKDLAERSKAHVKIPQTIVVIVNKNRIGVE